MNKNENLEYLLFGAILGGLSSSNQQSYDSLKKYQLPAKELEKLIDFSLKMKRELDTIPINVRLLVRLNLEKIDPNLQVKFQKCLELFALKYYSESILGLMLIIEKLLTVIIQKRAILPKKGLNELLQQADDLKIIKNENISFLTAYRHIRNQVAHEINTNHTKSKCSLLFEILLNLSYSAM